MGNRIICIGREFGSGGHQIALLLGQKLGLKVYEKDILHMACKYGDLQVSKMEASDEKATNPYLFETVHEGNYHVMRGLPTSEVLFALQQHEIKRIAQKEDCTLQVGFVNSVCYTYLILAIALFAVETRCRSHHDGLALIVKIGQTPLAELITVINWQACNCVERTHWDRGVDAWQFVQFINQAVSAFDILLVGIDCV